MTDSVTIRQQLAALHQQGFVLLPAVLDPAGIATLREAIDGLEPIHWDYQGLVDDHYKCVFNRSPFWLRFLDLSGVIELAESALGTDCHIIGQTAWRSRPGFIGGELHADYLAMELPESLLADPAFELPMQICTAHLYLDDIDADLCPTLVIPGSHRAGRKPQPGETQWHGRSAEPVLCKAGDMLLFRSDLWHAGSPNRSAERSRYLLQIHYGRRMVAQTCIWTTSTPTSARRWSSPAATAPDANRCRAKPSGTAARPSQCCARLATCCCFAATSGTPAAATAAPSAAATCCRSTMVGAWWRRSSRPTCTSASIPRCWLPPRRASAACSVSTRRPNTTEPLAPNLHRPRPAAPARPLTRIRQMRIRHDQQS